MESNLSFRNPWERVAVIGASGKMGKGISQIILEAQILQEASTSGMIGTGSFLLHLIDVNEKELFLLKDFLKKEIKTFAEKNINAFRNFFLGNRSLITNSDIVQYVEERAMGLTFFSTRVEDAKSSLLVFEAISENIEAKINVFKKLTSSLHIFTNTSSIPIAHLRKAARLPKNLIGFHFL